MRGIDTGKRKVVQIRYSMEAHFDCLVELNEDSIEKLKSKLTKTVYSGESIHAMLSANTGPGCYDFAFSDEDIEIHEAYILEDYPYHSGKQKQI